MITWEDTIQIIMLTFECKQQEIADQIGVSKSDMSKVKSGKRTPSSRFAPTHLYSKIFDPSKQGTLAHRSTDDENGCLVNLKDIIEKEFGHVKSNLEDCWNETDYKSFVMKLLERTKCPTASVNVSKNASIKLRHILPSKPLLFGREDELNRLSEIFETGNYAILTGIGGIGKSQIALAYAHMLSKSGDWTIQQIICEDSETLQQAILRLQFMDMPSAKTFNGAVKRLQNCRGNALIILDNLNCFFSSSDSKDFQKLVRCNHHIRILITSRYLLLKEKHCTISALPLNDDSLLKLYEYHRFEDHSDHSSYISKYKTILKQLFALVERHTLMITLLAKLPTRSMMNEQEIFEALETGFSLLSEDVTMVKDDTTIEANIGRIVKKVFDISHLTESERLLMMYLSLIPVCGINSDLFVELAECKKADITKLKECNWVIMDEETFNIRLHPVICEAILSMEDTQKFWHSKRKRLKKQNEDSLNEDEDDTIPDDCPNTPSVWAEPDIQEIKKFVFRFDTKEAKAFIRKILVGRRESNPETEEWHLFNQIFNCYITRIVFRDIFKHHTYHQLVNLFSGEYQDALMLLFDPVFQDARYGSDAKYIIQKR